MTRAFDTSEGGGQKLALSTSNLIMMKGYLTYTMAALAILGAGSGYLLGIIDAPTAMAVVWAGLSLFGVRRAISNNGTGQ